MKKLMELRNGKFIEIDIHPRGTRAKIETLFTVGAWLTFAALVYALAIMAYLFGGPHG